MSSPKLVSVITSIQAPTDSVRGLAARLVPLDAPLLILGDEKGPWTYDLPGARLIDLHEQRRLPYRLALSLPTRHYARKNLGYLVAAHAGAECLYETDDDNTPAAGWEPRTESCPAVPVAAESVPSRPSWLNVYRLFSDRLIWPRGFPLDLIREPKTWKAPDAGEAASVRAPIQQGLADRAPDVDAIWRLVLDEDFYFRPGRSVYLPPGTWCPFNSQTTWWWPSAYPLLYLPSHCSFRMTDIWRSFIAQRCLWAQGTGLVFHGPEVIQDRNPHNLLRDFAAEVSGYNGNDRLVDLLTALDLDPSPTATSANLRRCYQVLADGNYFPAAELALVDDWVADLAGA